MSTRKDRIEEIYCHIADCGLDERGDVIMELLSLLTLPCLLSLLPARRQHEIAGIEEGPDLCDYCDCDPCAC